MVNDKAWADITPEVEISVQRTSHGCISLWILWEDPAGRLKRWEIPVPMGKIPGKGCYEFVEGFLFERMGMNAIRVWRKRDRMHRPPKPRPTSISLKEAQDMVDRSRSVPDPLEQEDNLP